MIVVTTNDIPGYRVVQVIGLVRGLTVRSRSVIGNIGGAVQALFGGNISVYTNLAEKARAWDDLCLAAEVVERIEGAGVEARP